MAGLVPAIHVDTRHKAGYDENGTDSTQSGFAL